MRGELFRDSNGWAGAISHMSVGGERSAPYSRGRIECLDAMAWVTR